MAKLTGDEAPLSEPFWLVESVLEKQVVMALLLRRFPETYGILATSLEESDPLDVVYANNPSEYADVVAEILVLLSAMDGELRQLSDVEIEGLVREGLARRFGELPASERVKTAVRLIEERAARGCGS